MLDRKKTNVVLPAYVLETRNEADFLEKVQAYLNRYPDYQVIAVENGVGLCEIVEGRKTDDHKNKKSDY